MFDLVANFDDYPQFLPFCDRAIAKPVNDNQIEGTLFINRGPFKQSFTTRNTFHPKEKIIIELVNGPFRQLEGEWRFEDSTSGSLVTLDLTFDMKNSLLKFAMSGVFEVIAKSMVDSFCKEAHRRHQRKLN